MGTSVVGAGVGDAVGALASSLAEEVYQRPSSITISVLEARLKAIAAGHILTSAPRVAIFIFAAFYWH